MPSKDINCLHPGFQPAVRQLLQEAIRQGIPDVRVAETCRTREEQAEKVRKGYSKTMQSHHLKGEAVDIYVKDYDINLYNKLYAICQKIDYIVYPHIDHKWWQLYKFYDPMHFQYDPKKKVSKTTPTTPGKVEEVTREEAIKLVYRATQGHEPTGQEAAFANGFPENKLGELADLRFRDDVVGPIWDATTGEHNCPQSEKEFWQRYAKEHPEWHPGSLAMQWWNDHVVPRLNAVTAPEQLIVPIYVYRVTAKEGLNIRSTPRIEAGNIIGEKKFNETVEIVSRVEDQEINGNKIWFRLRDTEFGREAYAWSGGF